jgi:hypothetical protein
LNSGVLYSISNRAIIGKEQAGRPWSKRKVPAFGSWLLNDLFGARKLPIMENHIPSRWHPHFESLNNVKYGKSRHWISEIRSPGPAGFMMFKFTGKFSSSQFL